MRGCFLFLLFALCCGTCQATKVACQLRAAKESDVDTLYQLISELAVYEGKDLKTLPLTRENVQKFGFGENPYFTVELAEVDEKVVGYALYYYTFSANQGFPLLYVEDLYVQEPYRGQGIGSALLKKLAHFAKEKNCCRLEWHVFDWNEPAIHFYESIGAKLRRDLLLVRLEKEALNSFLTEGNCAFSVK